MLQDWLSGNSVHSGYSKDSDSLHTIKTALSETSFYNQEEVGLFHPENTSIVKIRENGMIDVFTATNQGIRIDPIHRTVNIIAKHEKHHLTDFTSWTEDATTFNSRRDFSINTESSLNMNAKQNWNVVIDGKADIYVKGDIDIKSEGAINIESEGDMHFNAPNYYWD